jgi:putative transposase
MANTFLKIYIQFVFSVKNRAHPIKPFKKELLHKYITGIVKDCGCKLLCVNSVPDHIHILTTLPATITISELMKEVKAGSSNFINDEKLSTGKFSWQDGYGAFSYSESQIPAVIEYIKNQEEHHKIKTFHEEYMEFLEKFNVEYDKRYVFDLEE